jgi:signal transduction histidine kinase
MADEEPERRHEGRRRADRERALLVDQLITAEQEERRRLGIHLHDTSVQSLTAVGLVLDAALNEIAAGNAEAAEPLVRKAAVQLRSTIRELRDLSFELEPPVLRDHGFRPALHELASRLTRTGGGQFELDVEAAETLHEKAKVTLYQIVREALHASVRRGPPSRFSVVVSDGADGGVEAVIVDDAPGERRERTFDGIRERARTLNGEVVVETGGDGRGTTVSVSLPPYAVRK